MTEVAIELSHIKKSFRARGSARRKDFDALVDLDLTLFKGEILGIVGESGSGKSTLGRCSFGIVPVTSGSVTVFGNEIAKISHSQARDLKKRMGFVFQDPIASLNPRMYVKDLIAEPMRMHSEFSSQIENRTNYLAQRVGLSVEQLQRRPHELSGGQCQRVAIARAISTNPEILLLDEPTSSLDLSVQAQILNLLADIRTEFELSYMLISHDLDVISHLSDRIIVLHNGLIIESGTTQNLITNPMTDYTKTLLRMKSGSGQLLVDTPVANILPVDFDLDVWQEAPLNRWAFQHVADFIPVAVIPRSDRPYVWKEKLAIDWRSIPIPECGDITNLLSDLFTDSLLVVREDRIVLEHYANGMAASSKHLLQSVSKGILGLLFGQLVAEKLIDVELLISDYLPELLGSGYEGAKIRHALDMTVGLEFSEEYHDPSSEIQRQDRSAGWRKKMNNDQDGIHAFLASLKSSGDHGMKFQYCSANTDVLAWVAERVCQKRYADILSERLWQPLGMATNASITVDSFGDALANGGISMTTRDLALLGVGILNADRLPGREVVPRDWISQTLEGAASDIQSVDYLQALHPGGSYRNQWWITKGEHGEFYCVGIYGQYIWIDPVTRTVVIKFSTLPMATNSEHSRAHMNLFKALSNHNF